MSISNIFQDKDSLQEINSMYIHTYFKSFLLFSEAVYNWHYYYYIKALVYSNTEHFLQRENTLHWLTTTFFLEFEEYITEILHLVHVLYELYACMSAHRKPVYTFRPSPHPCSQTHTPAESSSTIHHDKGKKLSAGYKAATGSQTVSNTVFSADCSSLI